MSEIRLNQLTVQFPDGTVGLDGIDLQVRPEEFIALVGPSGSGKTTLLRTIAGFLAPSAGTVHIGGRDVSAVPPEQRQIGMVFQQHAVWPHMSVARNIAYPLVRAGVPRARRAAAVERVLELVGLAGMGARRPESLSGGQRQRVALARAVVAEPSVLLLDEALSALDEPLRDALRRELVSLTRREGLTAVHVTHDRAEAFAIADRIVVLDQGRILQVAAPEELLRAPASPTVASFMCDATVLPARRVGAEVVCDSLGARWPLAECRVVDSAASGAAGAGSGMGAGTDTGAGSGSGTGAETRIAILPQDVTCVAPGESDLGGTVTSVLFERTGFSVTVSAPGGTSFRATSATRPAEGEAIGLRIAAPLVY